VHAAARDNLSTTADNSETMKTSAIWDFGTAECVSCSFVMLSRKDPGVCLLASVDGRAGGPIQMVHRATYSERDCCCSDKTAPSAVQHFRGCTVNFE
jgi:hypothetical protein